jgi:lysosomal Pro-X carboxypeptidase
MFCLNSDDGLKWLSETFKACKPFKQENGVVLKGYLTDLWTNVAMMNYPYSTSFLMPLPPNPVKVVYICLESDLNTRILMPH